MRGTGKLLLVILVAGLLGGGGGELEGFFESLAPGYQEKPEVSASLSTDAGDEAEELASPNSSCLLNSQVLVIYLDPSKYPYTAAHYRAAMSNGQPRIWHLELQGAQQRSAKNLAGWPSKPGYDLDQQPPAVVVESVDADISYVPSADNRAAGAFLEHHLHNYCDGQAFRLALKEAG